MSDNEGLELATITVTKTLYYDDVVIDVDHSDGLAVIDAVGMLAFAQHTLLTDPLIDHEEDDE